MIKVRTQTQSCQCKITIPLEVRAHGRAAINHYLRMLLCGFRPHYQPMLCPHCSTPFKLRITKE